VLSYTATYTQGSGEEYSEPVLIKVKRSVPGGLDPSPGTPEFNENLSLASSRLPIRLETPPCIN
jgi:hypothetical protein